MPPMQRHDMSVKRFKIYDTGYCTHPGCMVERGLGFDSKKFPALAILLELEDGRKILFDTGYSDHFLAATKKLPEKLYALATPASPSALVLKLAADGISHEEISTIILSHFHADHISGVKDFPRASLVCDHEGYEKLKETPRFRQVMKGFLSNLLPVDFEQRILWVERYPLALSMILGVKLEHELYACSVPELGGYLVSLPGHAAGHIGLLFRCLENWVFLCADAFWTEGNLADHLPNRLTHLIMDDAQSYQQTLSSLSGIQRSLGTSILLICSHESSVATRFPDIEQA